jgi:hypothetical protein
MLRAVPEMGAVANMVRHSHERWDGSGYPDGLAGEEIPLASRIILCADAFHAIRSDRPYRPGRSADEALTEVRRYAGEQFDPRVVEALVAIARDIRRANGSGISLPRSRRLAAMLAALAVFGGGSAYAASENVRHVVDEVVKAVGPGTVLQAAEAEAGSPDFALRPIDQVSQIIPVSILTPDLELAPFREAPPSYRGSPAESAIGDSVIAFVDEPAAAEDLVTGSAPAVEELRPPDTLIPAVVSPAPPLSTPVSAVSPDATAPALVPVENVAPEPDGEPPAVGNPHGDPPGQDNEQDPPPAEILPTAPPLVEITPPPEQPSEPAEEPEDEPEPPPDEESEPPPIPPIREELVASEESAAISPESYVPEIPAVDATKPDDDAAEPVVTETPTTE